MIERLTIPHKKLEDGRTVVPIIDSREVSKYAMKLYWKLKEYEDLEENGLLLRLPCKVGDMAYHIIQDRIADPPIYISEHEIQDVSVKAVYFADDWWTFEEMREMNAYLNKAEAERALAEMSKKVR